MVELVSMIVKVVSKMVKAVSRTFRWRRYCLDMVTFLVVKVVSMMVRVTLS